MTPLLRYVKFHGDHLQCDHCGARLARGAIELSDGLKYGRSCAARAMGRPRETSAMRKAVDALEAEAKRCNLREGYRRAAQQTATAKCIGKGYGGNVGWGFTYAYALADGTEILWVRDATTTNVIFQHMPHVILGAVQGDSYVQLRREEATELATRTGTALVWTDRVWADWDWGQGRWKQP